MTSQAKAFLKVQVLSRKLWLMLFGIPVVILILSLVLIGSVYYRNRASYVEYLIQPKADFPLVLEWQADLGRWTHDTPIYWNEMVVMPAQDFTNNWYGISADTGHKKWVRRSYGNGYLFRRCIAKGFLVISSNRALNVLQLETGELVWTKSGATTASCNDSQVFYSEVPRYSITAADLISGQNIWSGTEPLISFGGMIYNFEHEELLADHVAQLRYAIEPQTGRLRRSLGAITSYGPGGTLRGPSYLIDRNELFIGGTVQNAKTGEIIHSEEQFTTGYLPTVTSNSMYLSAGNDGIVAYDRATYDIEWIYSPQAKENGQKGKSVKSSLAILDGIGYAVFSDATLRAIDIESGQEIGYWQPDKDSLWDWPICTYPNPRFDCYEAAMAGITVSADSLFVSFGDGKLYAFSKDVP